MSAMNRAMMVGDAGIACSPRRLHHFSNICTVLPLNRSEPIVRAAKGALVYMPRRGFSRGSVAIRRFERLQMLNPRFKIVFREFVGNFARAQCLAEPELRFRLHLVDKI